MSCFVMFDVPFFTTNAGLNVVVDYTRPGYIDAAAVVAVVDDATPRVAKVLLAGAPDPVFIMGDPGDVMERLISALVAQDELSTP